MIVEIPHLADKEKCTGCTACVNRCPMSCIEMRKDKDGFAYPFVPDTSLCISCGLCESTCPIQNDHQPIRNEPMAFAAYSKDLSLRMASSSGGIFSEIAKEVLHNNGLVFGAAYDNEFKVYHTLIEKADDLSKLRGAKYAESWLGNSFSIIQEALDSGRQVLFTGTPCQVAGLKAYLNREDDNLLCIDFICHGVPSPMVWEKYIKYRSESDNKGEPPIAINLRDKSSGWSHYRYSNCFKYADGKEQRDLSNESGYMKLFTQDYILRASCGSCSFKGYSRSSDITLGDFWGIWNIAPEMDDDCGTSVVLIQSEKGRVFWNLILERIHFKKVLLEQVSKQNPSILTSSNHNIHREKVLEMIRTTGFGKVLPVKSSYVSGWKRIGRKLVRNLKEKWNI